MFYLSAITLGLLGSFHCIGMCGPIAIALPLKNDSWFTRILGAGLYNIGRSITYALLGAIFGLAGMGFKLGGLQQWVSIIMGAVMILSVIFPAVFRKSEQIDAIISRLVGRLIKRFRKMFSIRSYYSLFVIGILNGFLPCGLVYVAIAGAITTGTIPDGALYMFLFGLGTIPVMLSVSIVGNILTTRFRNIIRKVIPVFIVLIGIIFILRGMNLGIKYISPKMDKMNKTDTGYYQERADTFCDTKGICLF